MEHRARAVEPRRRLLAAAAKATSEVAPPALLACLALAAFEAARTLSHSGADLGASAMVQIPLFILGLFLLAGLPLGLLTLALADRALAHLDLAAAWARAKEHGATLMSAALAWLAALALFLAASLVVSRHIVETFASKKLTWLAISLAHLALLVVVWLIYILLRPMVAQALQRVATKRPWLTGPWTMLLMLTLALTAALAAGLPPLLKALEAADLRPAALAGAFMLTLPILFALWRALVAKGKVPRRLHPIWVLPSLLPLAITLFHLGTNQGVLAVLSRDTLLAGPIAAKAQRLADIDGDGYSFLFNGGDCNDLDAAVHPLALDIPDDGKDQNCSAGDLTLAAIPGLTRRPPPPRPSVLGEQGRPNILLITVDAQRADRMECYGAKRQTSPHLCALAEKHQIFAQPYSLSSTTRRSIPGLMTGRMPSALRWVDGTWPPKLDDQNVLITEVLQENGYHTAVIHCCDGCFDSAAGMVQGVDHIDLKSARTQGKKQTSAKEIVDKDLAYIDGMMKKGLASPDKPFFLWSHFFEPHEPYTKHRGHSTFGKEPIDRYDGEIHFLDSQIARLLDGLRDRGLLERTVVLFTADHGEEFYEHGNRFHGLSIYQELVHVPLIMAVPGLAARRIETPVSHLDVVPTLLDLAGVPIPLDAQGVSLRDMLEGRENAPSTPVLVELIPDRNIPRRKIGTVEGTWKLQYDVTGNYFELYDLQADPGETRNLIGHHPHRAAALRERLFQLAEGLLYDYRPYLKAGQGPQAHSELGSHDKSGQRAF